MSWVKKRIQQFNQGQKATWLEKRALEHADPINCLATCISFFVLVYGLWINNWNWIIASILIGFLGHLISWFRK